MKKVIIGFAVAMVATISQASYLYWQVKSSDVGSTFNGHRVDGFQVTAVDSSNNRYVLSEYAYNGSAYQILSPADVVSYEDATAGDRLAADMTYKVDAETSINTYQSGYSYYIEIVGYDSTYGAGTVLGVSETLTYAAASGHQTADLVSIASVPAAWTGGTYSAPEPTSGLLLLVGASLLALKRRKV